jgi:hypothetical protein
VASARAVIASKGRLGERLDRAIRPRGVAQLELAHRLAQEARLLAVAFDQGHLQPGRAIASGIPGRPGPVPRSARDVDAIQ